MTENKRFTIKRKNLKYAKILENGKDLTGYFFTAQTEFICDKWNELSEENEGLKQFQEKVAEVIESKMEDNACNDYKMEVLKEIWNELKLDEVWFE